MTHYDVVVIGGGASGMMAAIFAARAGKSVLVIEKNTTLGAKLQITGGGRCNITNAEYDIRKLLRHYGHAESFLYAPFSQFGVTDTFSFFELLGIRCKIEEHQRAFPLSEKAADVCRALVQEMKKYPLLSVQLGCRVTRIVEDSGHIMNLETSLGSMQGSHYILATGGMSHPETGSTGDGFQWLSRLGHTVLAPTPTLVPLRVSDAWVRACAGLTLDPMQLTFFLQGKKSFKVRGRLLCTHEGISGPIILNHSARVRELLDQGHVTATLDLFPGKDHGDLDREILELCNQHKNKIMRNILSEIVPQKLLISLEDYDELDILGHISPENLSMKVILETPAHSCTKEMRKALRDLLKAVPMTIHSLLGNDKAITVDGGVPLTEIDTRTMRSLKIKNLSITGDLLDINRPSGGYSLQLCWTTGYVAGIHTSVDSRETSQ